MSLELSVNRLPPRTQWLLLTILIVGLSSVACSYYIQPLKKEVDALAARIHPLTAEVQRAESLQDRLSDLKEQVRRQEEIFGTLRQFLPEEKGIAEIARNLQELAVQSNLKIKSLIPQKTIRRDFCEDWPILVSVEGNYHNLGLFFERLSQFARIINVDNIHIKRIEGEPSRSRTITATWTAITSVFREEPIVLLKSRREQLTDKAEISFQDES